MRCALIIPDGAADEPQESLGGKTPLQAAHTPAMDAIAGAGTVTAGDFAVDDLGISILGAGNIKFESIAAQTLQINMDGGGTTTMRTSRSG